MSPDDRVTPELVDYLLSLPTREQRSDFLDHAGLLDAKGLDGLLDAADRSLNDDSERAGRLAELCAELAAHAAAPAAVPRAMYVRAGVHSLNGEFEEDLRLTRAAYEGYIALGMNLEALRTNVGKMAALLELGRYGESLEAGQVVLDALEGKGELDVRPTQRQSDLLAALVHQNRGGCYEYMGLYDEALDAYASAEERYGALGMTQRLGEILDNRGAILLYLGRGHEALEAHEAAAVIFEEAGSVLSYARALSNIGETCLYMGNYRRSLDALGRSLRLLDSLGALADKHLLLRYIANDYLELNLYAEALAAYEEANEWLREAGIAHGRAQTLWGMGLALIALSDLARAEEALRSAAAMFEEAGNTPLLSGVMLEQASLRASSGDRQAALETARRALELVSGGDLPLEIIYAHLRLADLLLPEVAEAEPHLREAQRLAERLALPQLRYRLDERFGHLRRLQGRVEEARALLEAAVDQIERMRTTVTRDAMRASFLRDKTAAYEDLLRLYLDAGSEEDDRRAFHVAERAKSRALVDRLTGVVEVDSTFDDPELEAGLRELQADLNVTYGRMLGGAVDGESEVPLSELQARAAELEQETSRLRLRAATFASPPDPFAGSVPLDDIEARISPDTVLLAYHVVGDEIIAFVIASEGVRIARRLGTASGVQRLLRRLTVQWDRCRVGGGFADRHMELLERSAQRVLSALYDELIAPLEPLLGEATERVGGGAAAPRLVVVPHGPLHQVPFHALFDGERYLIDRFEISYAPSTTVHVLCQGQAPQDSGRDLVLGVEDPSIPAVISEARAVGKHLPGAGVLVGERATVAALREEAPGCGVLHLATHGLFRSDNPMFSALKLHDGWLVATDVMDLDLNGALVALSACESGRSEVIEGDEILGLTRAFLGAGAATLVVGLWIVQDASTATLMDSWYGRMREGGEGAAAALRAAQLGLKERYPHPYFWAPFVLIGKR